MIQLARTAGFVRKPAPWVRSPSTRAKRPSSISQSAAWAVASASWLATGSMPSACRQCRNIACPTRVGSLFFYAALPPCSAPPGASGRDAKQHGSIRGIDDANPVAIVVRSRRANYELSHGKLYPGARRCYDGRGGNDRDIFNREPSQGPPQFTAFG
jgi:hypothetical protein